MKVRLEVEEGAPTPHGGRGRSRGRHDKGLLTTLGPIPFARPVHQCKHYHEGSFVDEQRVHLIKTTYLPGVRRLMPRAGSQTQIEQAAQDLRCYASIEQQGEGQPIALFREKPSADALCRISRMKSLLRYSRALQSTEVKRGGDVHAVIAPMSLRLPV
jgi:hypothetical protein